MVSPIGDRGVRGLAGRRVLILNQTFHPDVASTGQLLFDLAKHLVGDHGARVHVLTARNFYGTDRVHDGMRERVDGIDIERVGISMWGRKSFVTRLADFGGYYAAAGARVATMPRPDVILGMTSPPHVSTLAMLARQARGVPYVHYVMDLYPDAVVAAGLLPSGSAAVRSLHHMTGRILSSASSVIALGRDMKERIIRNWPRQADASRIHVVAPWADGRAIRPTERADNPLARQLGLADTFNVVYSGNLGIAHELETIVQAIHLTAAQTGDAFDRADAVDRVANALDRQAAGSGGLRADRVGDRPLQWVFIGGGERFDDLSVLAAEHRWRHVRFLPFQPRNRLNESLGLADVHLVSQLPKFTGVVLPSKLFGILAAGRPTLFVGPSDAEVSRILADHSAGLTIPPGDGVGLVRAIDQYRASPALVAAAGAAARRALETNYDEPVATSRIAGILADACAAG